MVHLAIEWGPILEVLWVAPVAGIAVTVFFSLGIYGSTKAAEASRAKNGSGATRYGAIALVAFLAFAAAIVFGVYVILDK